MNTIYLLKEHQYEDTTWFIRIMSGILGTVNPKKDEVCVIDTNDFEKLPLDTVILIIGFSYAFISRTLERCLMHSLRPLVVGINPNNLLRNISYVTIDRGIAMQENVCSLIDAGATHIALIGINPSVHTDMTYLDGFLKGVAGKGVTDADHDIFYSHNDIKEAVNCFCQRARQYDAVCCSNDYTAIYLLSELKKFDIKVPEELAVTGFGNLDIAKYTNPPLSTIDMPLDHVGKQAIFLYKILSTSDAVSTIDCIIQHKPIYRGTTNDSMNPHSAIDTSSHNYTPFLNMAYEDSLKPIWSIANAYNNMDNTDRAIIRGIAQGKLYTEIADMCYISDSTLRYRLNKLYANTNVRNKNELKSLLNTYFPNFNTEITKPTK